MKFNKTLSALLIGSALLSGVAPVMAKSNPSHQQEQVRVDTLKIASFNLSFDRSTFEQLSDEMTTIKAEQDTLVAAYKKDKIAMEESVRIKAEKVIQIRNVAAIIQKNRPDVMLMGEFNNDGTGKDLTALKGFQNNYLSVPQSLNSIDGGDLLEPIMYPFMESFATNTGLNSGLDLDNDGQAGGGPGDAWGFGFYHGQYAFALMSRYELDTTEIRTFQQFLWKDLPGSINPTITNCDDEKNPIPEGMECGDNWYTDAEWEQRRLSSKNHVDVPVIIPTVKGNKTVHLLLSHPTPPVFDTVSQHNKLLNRDEVQFWAEYIDGKKFIYDDHGKKGGLKNNASFVIMGDLNADPVDGDGYIETVAALLGHEKVNIEASIGQHAPQSKGAYEANVMEDGSKSYPERVTSTFGLRVDHVIPSHDLNVVDSAVFWPSESEQGRLLMNDERIGNYGDGKDISSDHRMVWLTVDFSK
ncbi:endonuclease/exonuclease/phosphatase family protein [Vibrio sp. SS-MA-C1-2]|uniref:endonuclease/exonuclease/phosphatase family protein n=1 Tax=Vibrio sp. SS-MA-C1-2 TaxID=2908646 RepID=UPI001F42EA10|nr:endonuclease/exonuclease/phosphatase family protein [Vibrio sp. SS-MA-C1-2]UJF17024.1 endonuclease/exonuclease/phosphatase family protein [Vibrio sp. SS-MA-C1-2]